MNKISTITLFSALLLSQTSCVPLAVVGGAGAVGYTAAEERSVGTAIDDAGVEARINGKFLAQPNRKSFTHINTDSNEGRVLLTGSVPDQTTKMQATNLAWQVAGVKNVMNELKLQNKPKFSPAQYASDAWISTQLESRILFAEGVKSINYSIETIEGVVYLMGIAQSREELGTVTQIASEIPGVQKVVSYVRIKSAADFAAERSTNANRNSLPVGSSQPVTSVYEEPVGSTEGYSAPAVVIEESPNAQ